MTLRVLGRLSSINVRKVLWTCAELGLTFEREDWAQAQHLFHEALERDPQGDAAPEALYWEGVARYKATKNSAALAETARALAQRFAGAAWTKKASIWAPA